MLDQLCAIALETLDQTEKSSHILHSVDVQTHVQPRWMVVFWNDLGFDYSNGHGDM